jgi:hypothetical protein
MQNRKQIIEQAVGNAMDDFLRNTIAPHMLGRYDDLVAQLRAAEIASRREDTLQYLKSLSPQQRIGSLKPISMLKRKGLL